MRHSFVVAASLMFAAMPASAQTMTMPDGSKMDMKAMAPKPAPSKARAPAAKPKAEAKPADKPVAAPAATPEPAPEMPMPMPPAASVAPMPMPMPEKDAAPSAAAMDMSNMGAMAMTGLFGAYPMTRDASGTSWQPDAAPHEGLHATWGDWMLMGHARLMGIYDNQSGPRGASQTFAAGMVMGMARRDFAGGDTLNFRAMLSPDPLMGRRGYPLLLANGETADGETPLLDRQHPHDLFMELSGSYSHKFDDRNAVYLYLGYPGEPALGPPAFMHRASAMDDPAAPITHHWLDSTHITFGVATLGWVRDDWKLELSQFTGREPDQHRFNFDSPRMDSTAARVSWNPDSHWSLQASWGHLNSPEQLEPGLDETRYTASATYAAALGSEGFIAATLGWGLKSISDGQRLNGLFAEAEYKPAALWTLFSRAEWEQNAELVPGRVSPVKDFTIGGIRDFALDEHWKIGLGALYAFDGAPAGAGYGSTPHGSMAFVRLIAD